MRGGRQAHSGAGARGAQGLLPRERGLGAGGGDSSRLPAVASSAARATCCSSVRSARAAGPSPSASPPSQAACTPGVSRLLPVLPRCAQRTCQEALQHVR